MEFPLTMSEYKSEQLKIFKPAMSLKVSARQIACSIKVDCRSKILVASMQLTEPDLNVYSYSISHFQSSLKVEKLKGGECKRIKPISYLAKTLHRHCFTRL